MTALRLAQLAPQASLTPSNIALLGTGNVGSAFLSRLARLQANGVASQLRLVLAANSRRRCIDPCGLEPGTAQARLVDGEPHHLANIASHVGNNGVVIDATASEEVASWHPRWLAQGLAVVTANKAGAGGELARYRAIAANAWRYGDAATVGAGLPFLRTVRELRAGGDRIRGFAGVLSGSLAWLFNHYDDQRPFSSFVHEARARGYTEPDPRHDLSGQDVKRKLLILARAAGFPLEAHAVVVESLLPTTEPFAAANDIDLDAQLLALDVPLRERFETAKRDGRKLCFVARFDAQGRGRIGLEALAIDDALAAGVGCNNRLALWSDRYREHPLVIQGPGAGAEVTAAALLDDALRLASA